MYELCPRALVQYVIYLEVLIYSMFRHDAIHLGSSVYNLVSGTLKSLTVL